eukprot:GILK01009083.1.p1 GENE.GILK01009083.1~~GILK01009083.1.p1  ORF type:complete len:673 (+),score=123.79 GILK01009083.1:45-2021(+)
MATRASKLVLAFQTNNEAIKRKALLKSTWKQIADDSGEAQAFLNELTDIAQANVGSPDQLAIVIQVIDFAAQTVILRKVMESFVNKFVESALLPFISTGANMRLRLASIAAFKSFVEKFEHIMDPYLPVMLDQSVATLSTELDRLSVSEVNSEALLPTLDMLRLIGASNESILLSYADRLIPLNICLVRGCEAEELRLELLELFGLVLRLAFQSSLERQSHPLAKTSIPPFLPPTTNFGHISKAELSNFLESILEPSTFKSTYKTVVPLLPWVVGLSRLIFSTDDHAQLAARTLEPILQRLEVVDVNTAQGQSELTLLIRALTKWLRLADSDAVKSLLTQIYEVLDSQLVKVKSGGLPSSFVAKVRTLIVKCVTALLAAFGTDFAALAPRFLSSTAVHLADPLVLSDLIYVTKNNSDLLHKTLLPRIIPILDNALQPGNTNYSPSVRKLLMTALGRIAVNSGTLFKSYVQQSFRVMSTNLLKNKWTIGKETIYALAQLIQAEPVYMIESGLVVESIKLLFDTLRMDDSSHESDEESGGEEGAVQDAEEAEEEEDVDLLAQLVVAALESVEYLLDEPRLLPYIPVAELDDHLQAEACKPVFFEEDSMVRVHQFSLLNKLVQVQPSIAISESVKAAAQSVAASYPDLDCSSLLAKSLQHE